VRVKQEGSYAQCQTRNPEICNPSRPQCQSHEEQHHQGPHAKVDAGTSESRVQDTERDPGHSETTAGGDVTRTTKREVTRNRM
jgi:hypothetical protein